eukprot:SM000110S18939  [mRNA]  locus=s110:417927:422371:- [translate_table: standard]
MGCVNAKAYEDGRSPAGRSGGGGNGMAGGMAPAKQARLPSEVMASPQIPQKVLDQLMARREAEKLKPTGEQQSRRLSQSFDAGALPAEAAHRGSARGAPEVLTKSTTVHVPHGSFSIRFSYLTKRGYYPEVPGKANQDCLVATPSFGEDPNDHLFGVFDGHGENGTLCSQFARDRLAANLLADPLFHVDVEESFHSAFLLANAQLHRAAHIDDSMSGTTGIAVLLRGRQLYAANVGDSRAVLAERQGGAAPDDPPKLVAVNLSSDQTPFRADECDRVKAAGARVLTLDQLEGLKDPNIQSWGEEEDDDGDPPRLWVPNGMYPGTAFTRSVGDSVAERIGVSAQPEVLAVEVTAAHPFFVVASDGVFEFLSSQAVVDMVARYSDPYEACEAIVAESYRLWLQYETRTDDITIIVVHLEGIKEDGLPALPPIPPERLQSEAIKQRSQDGPRLSGGLLVPSGEALLAVRREPSKANRLATSGAVPGDAHDSIWTPRGDVPKKTSAEKEMLEQSLGGNFLFQHLSEKQKDLLLEHMERTLVNAGDILGQQGEPAEKFFVVERGQVDGLRAQEGGLSVEANFSSTTSPCFGIEALIHRSFNELTYRAASETILWTLDKETLWYLLLPRSARKHIQRSLRAADCLKSLSTLQLQRLAGSVFQLYFHKGEILAAPDKALDALYIVERGDLELVYHDKDQDWNWQRLSKDSSASYDEAAQPYSWNAAVSVQRPIFAEERRRLQCFGEWVLWGTPGPSLTLTATADLTRCLVVRHDVYTSVLADDDG